MNRCCRCHNRHAGARKTCAACLATSAAQRRANAARGLCGVPYCTSAPAPGRRSCERHLLEHRLDMVRRRGGSVTADPLAKVLDDFDSVL